jgi:hypothetical protein
MSTSHKLALAFRFLYQNVRAQIQLLAEGKKKGKAIPVTGRAGP